MPTAAPQPETGSTKPPTRSPRSQLVAFAGFLGLTLLLTFPQVAKIGSAVRDLGDPMLNTWILGRNVAALEAGRFATFFDAEIFHPYRNTLAYSEHLATETLVAWPVLAATGNPIAAHNTVLLLAFASAAFGMYLFALELTGSRRGAIVAGIGFAFAPHMYGQLSHLQSLVTAGFPLALLFLRRYLVAGRRRSLGAFAVVFVLQALANGYYAVYLATLVAVVVGYDLVRRRFRRPAHWWVEMTSAALAIALAVAPFFLPYLALRGELGFKRTVDFEATWSSFLNVPYFHPLWGRLLAQADSEGQMFPGLAFAALAAVGVVALARDRRDRRAAEPPAPTRKPRGLVAVDRAIAVAAALALAITLTGGIELSWLRARHAERQWLVVLGLLLVRLALVWRRPSSTAELWSGRSAIAFYGWVAAAAALATFGVPGPYELLYAYVPGYDGLRVATRLHVVVLLGLGLLAAAGVAWLETKRLGASARRALALLPLFVAFESSAAPLPLDGVPPPSPEVYRWLAEQPDGVVIAELPLPKPGLAGPNPEFVRLYGMLEHHKRSFNGWSGYLSPAYQAMQVGWDAQPLADHLEVLRAAGVRYILVHVDEPDRASSKPLRRQLRAQTCATLARTIGATEVWELDPARSCREENAGARKRRRPNGSRHGDAARRGDGSRPTLSRSPG